MKSRNWKARKALGACELARRLAIAKEGVKAVALAMDPGLMPGAELARDFPKFMMQLLLAPLVSMMGWFDKGIRRPDASKRDLAGQRCLKSETRPQHAVRLRRSFFGQCAKADAAEVMLLKKSNKHPATLKLLQHMPSSMILISSTQTQRMAQLTRK